jgi:hypothetical protein
MRFFPPSIDEYQRRQAPGKVAVLVFTVLLAPALALYTDWRLGAAVIVAYGALGFGVWRVSKQR